MAASSRPCPVCGAASVYALTAGDRNRETTEERFVYNRCVACSTVFMVDVPADLSPYHRGDYHGFGPDGAPGWKRNRALQEVEASRARMLKCHLELGALIDVGAGSGGFAAAARDAGFEVTAIEMDAHCCEYLQGSLGVRAICTDEPVEQVRALPRARSRCGTCSSIYETPPRCSLPPPGVSSRAECSRSACPIRARCSFVYSVVAGTI
jgi:hypothetical protein